MSHDALVQDELRALAEGLAARVHRAVAIDDPQMRLLAHTAHDEAVDEHRIASVMRREAPAHIVAHAMSFGLAAATGPVRVRRWPEQGLLGRVAVPVRCEGQLLGYLWLIDDDDTLTAADLRMAEETAAAVGQLLHRERLLGSLRHTRQRELLRDLLADDLSARAHAAALLVAEDMVPPGSQVVVVAVRLSTVMTAENPAAAAMLDHALERTARHLTPITALTLSRPGGHGVLLVSDPKLHSRGNLRSHLEELRDDLVKTVHDEDVRVAVGPLVESLEQAHRSLARAEDAIRVASVVPGFPPVVAYDELGVYRLLVHLPLDELPDDAIPVGLRRLLERDGSGQLVQTLEVYLDEAGDARASVQRLAVHRTSLYYRLSRIEEITGMKLADGGDRLALHLGLKLARLTGLL